MPFVADSSLDAALTDIKRADRLLLLSSAPTSYADAVSKTLGYKASPTLGAIADGVVNGRRFTVSAFNDGVVSATGGSTSGECWALVLVGTSELLAYNDVTGDQAVTSGNTWSCAAFDVAIADA